MPCWTRLFTLLLASTFCGAEWVTNLTARYYSLTHTIYTLEDLRDDGSNRTHKYIFIKAGSTEKAPLVQTKLSSSDEFDACNTDVIRVYSGATEDDGLYMGSFCGGVYDEIFQASDNAMFLVIEVDKMPQYFILTIKYYTVTECRTDLFVRSLPRYLRSPSFRDSGSTDIYSCRWTMATHNTKRIRVTFKFAPGYSPDCLKNVSLSESDSDSFLTGRVFAHWCGGEDDVFVSFYSHVLVTFNTGFQGFTSYGLPPVEMKFDAVEEEECYSELVVKEGEGGSIASPGYPSGITPGKVCKWKITTEPRRSRVIRINVTDTNLADTPGCTKDIVRVYDVYSYNSPVTESWCGSATPVFELYTSSLVVEFRSGFYHSRDYRGFTLHYLSAEEPLCSHSLTAGSSRQFITSPGFPQPFRSYMKCKWKISSTSRELVIKLDVTKSDLEKIPRPSCSRSRLMVYEGETEDAHLLKSWCRDEPVSLQSRGQHLLVVFLSENNDLDARDGFSMEYREGQYEDTVEVSTEQVAITFPSTPFYYYTPGYDAHWTFYSKQAVHHVALRYTAVYLNCPSDVITITDGDMGDSPRIFTFCGGDDRSHFSSTGVVTVAFTTRTNKGRGFTMTYQLVYYPGCFRNIQEVNVEIPESYLSSPGLPYYDNLDCSWRFVARDPSHLIKMKIEVYDVITYSDVRCPTDYLRIYNGHDTASLKVTPLMCGINKEWVRYSSTRYMYVEFHTDEFKSGKGFKISYSSYLPASSSESQTSSFPTAVVVGVVVSLILLIAVCTLIFLCRRRRRLHRRSNPPQPPEHISSIRYTQTPVPPDTPLPSAPLPEWAPPSSNQIPSEAPPSYYEIERLDPGGKDDEALPPTYIEAVTEGMECYTPQEPSQYGYL